MCSSQKCCIVCTCSHASHIFIITPLKWYKWQLETAEVPWLYFLFMCWLLVFVTLMVTSNALLHCLQHLPCLQMTICMLCSVCVHACLCACLNWVPSELTFILGPTVTLENWKQHRHIAPSSCLLCSFFFLFLISVEKHVLSFKLRQCGCTYVSEQNSSPNVEA